MVKRKKNAVIPLMWLQRMKPFLLNILVNENPPYPVSGCVLEGVFGDGGHVGIWIQPAHGGKGVWHGGGVRK